jgi:predicted RNA-binding protein with PIN domain
MFGKGLPDPGGVLVGEGKRLRHVKVRSLEQARDRVLERLVEAAWERKNNI